MAEDTNNEISLSKKGSELPEVVASGLQDTDLFIVVSQGVTSKIRKAELDTALGGAGGGTAVLPPAEGRTVADATAYLNNNRIYNIRDFGAVGDDTTDDSAAIAATVAAAQLNGGGRILIPLGTYKITTNEAFDIDFSNVEIYGEGRGSIIKLYADGNLDATDKWGVKITGVTSNVFIHDFRITSAIGTDTSRQNGIGSPSGQTLKNIHVYNMEIDQTILGASFNGNAGSFSVGSMRHNYVHDIHGTGSGTGYGLHIDTASEVIAESNVIENCSRHGIYHARTVVGVPANNQLVNNRFLRHRNDVFEGAYRCALVVSRSQGVTVSNNFFFDGYDGALEVSHTTSDPGVYDCLDITVTNNTFATRKNLVPYIIVGEQLVPTLSITKGLIIENNKFFDDALVVPQYDAFITILNGLFVSIQNNLFRRINCNTAVTQRAINLAHSTYSNDIAHCDHFSVRGNTFEFTGSDLSDVRAINIDSPLANNQADIAISDNMLSGVTYMDYYNVARTNTAMRVAGNNMPSTSAVADGGFYVGNTAVAAGGVGAPAGGQDTEIQFNDGGNLFGAPSFTFNKVTGRFKMGPANITGIPASHRFVAVSNDATSAGYATFHIIGQPLADNLAAGSQYAMSIATTDNVLHRLYTMIADVAHADDLTTRFFSLRDDQSLEYLMTIDANKAVTFGGDVTANGKLLTDGEKNTAANIGTGDGAVFAQKVGSELQFRNLFAGANMTFTVTTQDIIIGTTAEINTSSNVGAGEGLALPKSGVNLPFKSLVAGSGITLSSDADEITIAATGGSAGEANTTSNVGTGAGLALPKSGVNLPFKSIIAGPNISITENANDITIEGTGTAVGEANTSSNQGAGVGLAMAKSGVDLPFKTLVAGANITLTPAADTVTIDAAGGGGGGTPGGADNQFQYNNGGVFGGVSTMQYDEVSGRIVISGSIASGSAALDIYNSQANDGRGLKIRTAKSQMLDGNAPALYVADPTNAHRNLQFYAEDGLLSIGQEPSAIQWPLPANSYNPANDFKGGMDIGNDALHLHNTGAGANADIVWFANAVVNGSSDPAAGPGTQNGLGLNGLSSGRLHVARMGLSGGDAGFRIETNKYTTPSVPGVGTITVNNDGTFTLSNPVPAGIEAGLPDYGGERGVIWFAGGGQGIKTLAADRLSGTTWTTAGAFVGTHTITNYTNTGPVDPNLPSIKFGGDYLSFGWRYTEPANSTGGHTAGWTAKGDFILRLLFNYTGSQLAVDKYDTFADYNPGRAIQFATSTGTYPATTPVFRMLSSDAGVDRVEVYVNGALRRMKSYNDGLGRLVLYVDA